MHMQENSPKFIVLGPETDTTKIFSMGIFFLVAPYIGWIITYFWNFTDFGPVFVWQTFVHQLLKSLWDNFGERA